MDSLLSVANLTMSVLSLQKDYPYDFERWEGHIVNREGKLLAKVIDAESITEVHRLKEE